MAGVTSAETNLPSLVFRLLTVMNNKETVTFRKSNALYHLHLWPPAGAAALLLSARLSLSGFLTQPRIRSRNELLSQ